MSQPKVKIGIVGIGSMGTDHVDHVIDLPNTELTAICDRRFELLEADAYPEIPRYTDYEQMLAAADLDAVIIATPHYHHPDMCLQAFERGLHVLVEKPIAVHVGEAQRLLDGARAAKREHPELVFAAMFMQRTWGRWRKVKEIVAGGALGSLMRCSWIITDWYRTQYYFDSRPWRGAWASEGGGVLMNQCPHNLDLFQWLVGMPARVTGQVSFGKHHHIEVEDEVTAIFEYDMACWDISSPRPANHPAPTGSRSSAIAASWWSRVMSWRYTVTSGRPASIFAKPAKATNCPSIAS